MLKKGVILDNAPSHELTKKIEGKVWKVPCREAEVHELQSRFRVTNISREEESSAITLRVLAEKKPTESAKQISPTLEDYYLYTFGENSTV